CLGICGFAQTETVGEIWERPWCTGILGATGDDMENEALVLAHALGDGEYGFGDAILFLARPDVGDVEDAEPGGGWCGGTVIGIKRHFGFPLGQDVACGTACDAKGKRQ